MLKSLCFLSLALVLVGCNFRRDTPDETKVKAYPEWRAAPTLDLPLPR